LNADTTGGTKDGNVDVNYRGIGDAVNVIAAYCSGNGETCCQFFTNDHADAQYNVIVRADTCWRWDGVGGGERYPGE